MIRTFELSRGQREFGEQSALLDAFRTLCETTLDHPGLARPLAFGTEGNIPYIVYADLAGTTMEAVMRQHGPRPVAEVLQRARQLAEAIDAAASAGVQHGLLAPGDVILDGERTGITGCGLAQALIAARIPAEGVSPYCSPQRLAGAPPTRADDVYSLAALTLELLIGTPRDPDKETRALREAQGLPERRRLPRPAPHETRLFTTIPGVDAGKLRAAFAAAFSDEPGDRPSTAAEFVAGVQDACSTRREPDEQSPSAVPVRAVGEQREVPPAAPDAAPLEPPSRQAHAPAEGRAARRRRARARRRERPAASAPVTQEAPKSEPRERPSEIRATRPAPVVDVDVEVLEDAAAIRSLERVPPPRAPSMHHASYAHPIRTESRIFLVASVVVVSFAAGFGGGFVAGHLSRPSTGPTDVVRHESAAVPEPARAAEEDPRPVAATTQPAAPTPEEGTAKDPIATKQHAVAPASTSSSSESRAAVAAPPAAVPVAASGRLLVRSTPPGAAVVLNGQKRGVTPLALDELAFGTHTIELSHPGHGTRRQRVSLTERRPARAVAVTLRPASAPADADAEPSSTGSLQVISRPAGAQVFVDDDLIGTTPFVVSSIAPGSKRLRIELPGYQVWTRSVQIEPGVRSRVSAGLEP